MPRSILLGDESVALGAIHAGLTAAYAYPGTPSTEIMEFLLDHASRHGRPHASWCANEKTAYEEALGVSFAGRRAMVSMKHVGLNVAADPFVNSALVSLHGGLVVAVADDPGMHSSQNEQDSRFYADFARIVCLEPSSQQQAYDMTREAFDLSEHFRIPVMVRLVTRLAHSRTAVTIGEAEPENPLRKAPDRSSWILLPAIARRQWRALLDRQREIVAWSESCHWNALALEGARDGLGVITAGLAINYYRECAGELAEKPSHLHIGTYPLSVEKIRRLAAHAGRILVLEDGFPLIERQLRGLLPSGLEIRGRMSGEVPADGELSPEVVRAALGLAALPRLIAESGPVPARPPQLCSGCPHGHSYHALHEAFEGFENTMVTADIGCYTLGALSPYSAIESCVCMGASIGMAKGAAEAGFHPVVAVIGDSTFLHSGITALLDAVAADADITVLILDNQAVGMTGAQDPIVPSARLREIVLGLGVDRAHCHGVEAHPRRVRQNGQILRRELEHRGLSVVIASSPCKEIVRRRARAEQATATAPTAEVPT